MFISDDDDLTKEEYKRFLLDFMNVPSSKVDQISDEGYAAMTEVMKPLL